MKITTGLILNVLDHGWTIKETFYSRSPKMTFNAISFIFYSNWKNIRFPSYTTRLLFKRIVLKNCVKNHLKINYVEFCIYAEKKLSLLL